MKCIDLLSREVFRDSEAYHMVRSSLETKRPKALHSQDFYELIWVQNGQMRITLADTKIDLSEGNLVFIRESESHGLHARTDDTFVVSVSFAADFINGLGARHPELSDKFFWSKNPTPHVAFREMRELASLNQKALRLERVARTRLEAEAFLIPLCAELVDEVKETREQAPDWLVMACAAAQHPEVFREGAAGFVAVTGRAHAHVSRTAKAVLGLTPSEYVNKIRMEYAGRRLAGTPDQLAEIAADCGIPNLSHFHKCFSSHFGITPHQFRLKMQRNLLQPS